MAIRTGIGKLFLEELGTGIHTLSEGTPDTIKCAFYGPNASLSPLNPAYTPAGEIAGAGYTAGGVEVPLAIIGVSGSSRNAGTQFEHPYIQPLNDTQINVSGVGIRGCMLYNESQSNRNIFTLDFGSTFSPDTGLLIRWGVSNVDEIRKALIPLIARQF